MHRVTTEMAYNMSSRQAGVHLGTAPSEFRAWETVPIYFHGFESLPTARGQSVRSPEFNCFGLQWCAEIYPGGDVNSAEGCASFYLRNLSSESIHIQFGLNVKDVVPSSTH